MPDQLYLSFWLRGFTPGKTLDALERLLGNFPFSQLRPGVSTLRIYAMEFTEPPLFEHTFAGLTDLGTVMSMCAEFENADCAYVIDGWWESMQFVHGAWQLAPSRVTLTCFSPEFENEEGDHLRIDLGPDANYLPQAGSPESVPLVQANVKGLLRMAAALEEKLPVERRKLWSESEDDFLERLEDAIDE